jgi:hypothetical protein
MSTRYVVTDDSTGEEIPPGNWYWEVSVRLDQHGYVTYVHYEKLTTVLQYIHDFEPHHIDNPYTEIIIKRKVQR